MIQIWAAVMRKYWTYLKCPRALNQSDVLRTGQTRHSLLTGKIKQQQQDEINNISRQQQFSLIIRHTFWCLCKWKRNIVNRQKSIRGNAEQLLFTPTGAGNQNALQLQGNWSLCGSQHTFPKLEELFFYQPTHETPQLKTTLNALSGGCQRAFWETTNWSGSGRGWGWRLRLKWINSKVNSISQS